VALDRLSDCVEVRGLNRRDILGIEILGENVNPTRSANRTVTILRSIRLEAMKDWIIIAILYGFGIGCFRLLGGINAAGEALRRWGRASSSVNGSPSSSSS